MLRAAVLHELVPQSLNDPVEHGKRPASFEDPLGRLIVRRLALVALFARREFERDNRPAAPFLRALAIFFVSDKELQRGQKKRSEPALFRVSTIEIPPFEHADEEVLREILRLIGWIAAPAQIGVQRIPVVLTQRNQSRPGFLPLRSTAPVVPPIKVRYRPLVIVPDFTNAIGDFFSIASVASIPLGMSLNSMRARADAFFIT